MVKGLSGWALVRVGMLMVGKWFDVVSGGDCCVVWAFGVACCGCLVVSGGC